MTDSKILALIGSGHQSFSHARLLKCVRNFTEIRIWSRNFENAQKLANKVDGVACNSVEEAVKDADVIVTVTLSKEPVLFGKWTKQKCLINSKYISLYMSVHAFTVQWKVKICLFFEFPSILVHLKEVSIKGVVN